MVHTKGFLFLFSIAKLLTQLKVARYINIHGIFDKLVKGLFKTGFYKKDINIGFHLFILFFVFLTETGNAFWLQT